jgi:DNA-binding NarL/FixJ family response regulator
LLLSRKSGEAPLRLTVTPFRSHLLVGGSGQLRALVFIADPAKTPPSRFDVLRSLYGLAPTEGRIADALAGGFDVTAIAERFTLTQETVRFYLKSIFRVNRQSDLMRLILGLPAV